VDVSFIVLQILAAHRTCMIESFRVTGSRCSLRACFPTHDSSHPGYGSHIEGAPDI
jgi:hypothetical protein